MLIFFSVKILEQKVEMLNQSQSTLSLSKLSRGHGQERKGSLIRVVYDDQVDNLAGN